jgi:hypothetical protein
MGTEHTGNVVERAVAYMKDVLGLTPADKTPEVQAKPEFPDTAPEINSEDAMRLDPNAYTFKTVAEVYTGSGQRPGVE